MTEKGRGELRAKSLLTKEMDKVSEIEKFTVSIEGNRLTAKIIGDDGTRIKIPSALWPLKGKRDYCFFSENTIPCEDETIRSIYDSIEFKTGKCYANAEKLRQQLTDAGYPAKFFCGWLFVGSVEHPKNAPGSHRKRCTDLIRELV